MRTPAQAPRLRRIALCALAAAVLAAPSAQAAEPLPQPLTLDYALTLASEPHPSLELSRSRLALAEARRLQVEADDNLQADLSLNARYIDDSSLLNQVQNDDSSAVLLVRKRLYDFGRSARGLEAAEAEVRSRELLLQDTLIQRRLEIMQAFFNVILADLDFARANEEMATAYVELDRARDRNELGQVSDIEVLRLEDLYQDSRLARIRAEKRQRATRMALAQALNRPDDLPAEVLPPELPANDSLLPDYEALVARALAGNPRLLALRQELEAARLRVAERRRGGYPTLTATANAGYWSRDLGNNREPFGASLILDIPLYTGGRIDAAVAEAQAQSLQLQAQVGQLEHELRQAVLETWQELQSLQAQREQAQVRRDYRDLYLDRSRARYELEIKADLGDAMAEQTAARLFAARTEYALALAWARLAALTGATDFSPLKPPAENPLAADAGATP